MIKAARRVVLSSGLVFVANALANLQRPHVERSPAETLQHLAEDCQTLGIGDNSWDVYGDFDQTVETSFLRRFEAEMAQELGMDDAVFMPSGGMAQSIALRIHANRNNGKKDGTPTTKSYFACHHTSHLLLHEQDAYRELLEMEAIVISTVEQAEGISIPPMRFENVQQALDPHSNNSSDRKVSTLLLELPHREIGGKLTPWQDVIRMQNYCQEHNIAFHLDGARIFEATTGYDNNDMSLQDMCSPFDSVYISFYKGLGGISGAMLLGSQDFCDQARVWLRRFGGNLYTLLPYAVSGWAGYRRQWKLEGREDVRLLSFREKKEKLVALVSALTRDGEVSKVLAFDPPIPETSMVHGYLRVSAEECAAVLDSVERDTNIRLLSRVRPISEEDPAYPQGFRSKFEWAMGESNCHVSESTVLQGWRRFVEGLT